MRCEAQLSKDGVGRISGYQTDLHCHRETVEHNRKGDTVVDIVSIIVVNPFEEEAYLATCSRTCLVSLVY